MPRAHDRPATQLARIVSEAGRAGVLPIDSDVDFSVEALLAATAHPSWQCLVEREGPPYATRRLLPVHGDGEALPDD